MSNLHPPTTTDAQYDQAIDRCRDIFCKKTHDYGTAWRILRPSSLTDQLYIKALRIRGIEERGNSKIAEGVEAEYIGLVNYSLMAMIQLAAPPNLPTDLPAEHALALYNHEVAEAKQLMQAKNHDYGEAWRLMRVSSLTDLILQKILRIKQIEDNKGNTIASEGVVANYQDIVNYAIFALIRLSESILHH